MVRVLWKQVECQTCFWIHILELCSPFMFTVMEPSIHEKFEIGLG